MAIHTTSSKTPHLRIRRRNRPSRFIRFFQYSTGRRVSDHVLSINPVELEVSKTEADDDLGGFCRIAVSPKFHADTGSLISIAKDRSQAVLHRLAHRDDLNLRQA